MTYKVPAGDGETLNDPPRDQLDQLVESNHTLLDGYDFAVGKTSFSSLRSAARKRVAAEAGQRFSSERRFVVGAHQPGFHGPGILYKHNVLQSLARRNLAVNCVVDSDVCRQVSVRIPCSRPAGVGLNEVVVFPNANAVAFERLSVPRKATVDLAYDRIQQLLESLGENSMLAAFRKFRAVHDEGFTERHSAAEVLTDYRSRYYPTQDVHEHFISAISRSPEFLLFASQIIRHIERFAAAYNSSLARHRRRHRIRSLANPFPDLGRDGEFWETPFWGLDASGRRHKLFAGGSARSRYLRSDDSSARRSLADPESLAALRIRPRAVCLTMYLRLFLADLFVHGVGGGNYDQVTDRIVRTYYGVQPPAYAVCSRTKFLSIQEVSDSEQTAIGLRLQLRQMRHNPEKFVPPGSALAEDVSRILSESGGKLSREDDLHLREVRRATLHQIAPQVALIEKELEQVEQKLQGQAAFRRRGLPYFLYPLSQL